MITGERVVTRAGGFNPTWQRHVAAYVAADALLPPEGRVLDLGCGVGHSFERLAPRETVGVDLEPSVLEGQARTTVAADMRALPFPAGTFASVVSVQSLEHVPDPERVLEEVVRVLRPGGSAVFVTPNRLTFLRPDEIVDPYHFVEFDPRELRALLARHFAGVRVLGLFGTPRYLALVAQEKATMDRVLALDRLQLRRALPRRARQLAYDTALTLRRRRPVPGAAAIGPEDFRVSADDLDRALDLVAVCRRA